MNNRFYTSLLEKKAKKQKSFAVLIDPDGIELKDVDALVAIATDARVDYFFIGGSLVMSHHLDEVVLRIKAVSDIPVVLFPGSPSQVTQHADALLYLSLISGRNPELLIGQHVVSAPLIKSSGLEVVPTGYVVVDGGAPTSVSYMSNTAPLPADKNNIATCTAMAGEMLGLRLIYMDAGSGAKNPVSESMITAVSSQIEVPLIVGGGISTPEKASANCAAGADVIVVGNAIEKDKSLIAAIAAAVHG